VNNWRGHSLALNLAAEEPACVRGVIQKGAHLCIRPIIGAWPSDRHNLCPPRLAANDRCWREAGIGQNCDVRTYGFGAVYLFDRRHVAGAVPNAFLKAREKAASEL
jgi:hypothetical protein